MIYRNWALSNAVWTTKGNLTKRAATDPSYPSWLLQAPLWTEMWSTPGLPQEASAQIQENIRLAHALSTPIGTHWYLLRITLVDNSESRVQSWSISQNSDQVNSKPNYHIVPITIISELVRIPVRLILSFQFPDYTVMYYGAGTGGTNRCLTRIIRSIPQKKVSPTPRLLCSLLTPRFMLFRM
eukprot:COSAG02_NODE_100_length_36897_cov_9.681749_20_plen_183_part_00